MRQAEYPAAALPLGDWSVPGEAGGAPSGDRPADATAGISDRDASELVALLWRRRRVLLLWTGLMLVIAAATAFVPARTWTSRTSFLPQQRRAAGASALAGVAAQFGVPLPTGDAGQSPQFYADLVRSRPILRAAVDSLPGTSAARAAQLLGVDAADPRQRREDAIDALRRATDVTLNTKTGVIELRVRLRDPAAARMFAERLLTLVDQFNRGTRQTQAGQERRYTAQRVTEAEAELRAAESRLQAFLQGNRDLGGSAELQLARERLARDVTFRTSVYATLLQAAEQARLDEVRDTPVLTVLEAPETPARPDPRGTLSKLALGLVAGLTLGGAYVLLTDAAGRARMRSGPRRPAPEPRDDGPGRRRNAAADPMAARE